MKAPELETARIEWHPDGTPVASRFDDPYFSLRDGLAETRHVFLAGNDLPARLVPGFRIAELGFGTGLNAAAAALDWLRAGLPGPLQMTSFEAYPMALPDMARALARWPELASVTGPLLQELGSAGPDQGRIIAHTPALSLTIVLGDARETLPRWSGQADAWFLDGFSPARNPQMWQPDLMVQVARHTAPGGTFATYSAAGSVRRALAGAGFEVIRAPGFAHKRHMSRGHLPDSRS